MKLLLTLLAALVITTSLAAADPKVYPAAKLSITLPDKWKSKDAKNGITMVGAPADDAGMVIYPVTTPTPDGVRKSVEDLLAAMKVTDLKWDKDIKQDKLNGVPVFVRKGTGTADKKPMDIGVMLAVNDKAGLVVMAVVQHDKSDGYKAELNKSFGSVAVTK
jgi:hypothetical protein